MIFGDRNRSKRKAQVEWPGLFLIVSPHRQLRNYSTSSIFAYEIEVIY